MYNAPSVAYPVGRCAFQRQVFAACMVLAVGVLVAWATLQPLTGLWYGSVCATLAGGVGGWRAIHVAGVLQWQGEAWVFWRPSAQAVNPWQGGVVRLAFDAQRVLLLQWTPTLDETDNATQSVLGVPRRSEWLWLAKDNAPDHWQDVRRAVHAQTTVF